MGVIDLANRFNHIQCKRTAAQHRHRAALDGLSKMRKLREILMAIVCGDHDPFYYEEAWDLLEHIDEAFEDLGQAVNRRPS